MSELKKLKKMLTSGYLKEAAEWVKEGPVPFLNESELRAVLDMLADAIIADDGRPGKFHGQKPLPRENGVKRKVSQREWERQIYHAVCANVGAGGRVKKGTYASVAESYCTSEPNVKLIFSKLKTS